MTYDFVRIKKTLPALKQLALAGVLAMGPILPSQAATLSSFSFYDQSGDFNAFILGDIVDYSNDDPVQTTETTDIEGPVAVAGNITSTGDPISLTIGKKLSETAGYDGSQNALVVGGNVENQNNTIYGSVWVGGDADFGSGLTIDGNVTVGGNLDYNAGGTGGEIGKVLNNNGTPAQVLTGGNATFGDRSNVFGSVSSNQNIIVNGDGMGDTTSFNANGSVIHNNFDPYIEGSPRENEGAGPFVLPASPVDFVAMDAGLKSDSILLSQLVSNATTQQDTLGHNGVLLDTTTSTAADGELIIFDLGLNLDFLWKNGFTITSDKNAEVLINVSGDTHTITDFAFFIDPILSLSNIVWNFFEATTINLGEDGGTGIGFKGNILAPLADIFFYNGLIEGNVVANSLTGDGQINWLVDTVPTPSSLFVTVFGLMVLSWVFWSRQRPARLRA